MGDGTPGRERKKLRGERGLVTGRGGVEPLTTVTEQEEIKALASLAAWSLSRTEWGPLVLGCRAPLPWNKAARPGRGKGLVWGRSAGAEERGRRRKQGESPGAEQIVATVTSKEGVSLCWWGTVSPVCLRGLGHRR